MPAIQRPPKLRPGATIGIVSPSSLSDPLELHWGLELLRERGYRIRLGEATRKLRQRGSLAASDAERASELMAAFKDPKIDAIICSTGGYGAMRILDKLDYDVIRDHPKALVGYSDITALHLALQQQVGLVSFHGPTLSFWEERRDVERKRTVDRANHERMLEVLEGKHFPGPLANPPEAMLIRTIRDGRARGRLIGGNLTLLCSSLGTPFELKSKGRLLVIEEWKESYYYIEAHLNHLGMAGKLAAAAGIIGGEISEMLPAQGPTRSVEELLLEHLEPLPIPSVYGLCCGHGLHQLTVPMGARARLDATSATLDVLEPVVD